MVYCGLDQSNDRFGFFCNRKKCDVHAYTVSAKNFTEAKKLANCPECNSRWKPAIQTRELICPKCKTVTTAKAEVYTEFETMTCKECETFLVRNDMKDKAGICILSETIESFSTPEWFSERLNKMNDDLGTNAKPLL